jgi:hypothetical protein
VLQVAVTLNLSAEAPPPKHILSPKIFLSENQDRKKVSEEFVLGEIILERGAVSHEAEEGGCASTHHVA